MVKNLHIVLQSGVFLLLRSPAVTLRYHQLKRLVHPKIQTRLDISIFFIGAHPPLILVLSL